MAGVEKIGKVSTSGHSQGSTPSNNNASIIIDSSTSKKRKGSEIWEKDFSKDLANAKATCLHCQKIFVHTPSNGTSTLRKHLHSSCLHYKRKQMTQTQLSGNHESSNELRIIKFNQEQSKDDITRCIVMCELPFSIVDHPAFRIMIQNLQPDFILNHKTAKTKDILQLYRKEKKILQDLILKSKGRISFTTDTWTSIQTMCYMSITAHYIDGNWKLQKNIINFLHLDERHTGIILSLAIEKCLAEWRIEDKLCAIVLDNVSANNIVASTLKGRYQLSLPLAGKFFHIRCSAHILNLIVKEGMKELEDNIVRIRDAVKFVLSSPQRLKVFTELKLGDRGLLLDCVTRWNSTYHMLKRALEHKEVFYRFNLVESFKHPPTENDWSIAQELCNFLKVFDDSTNIFSATKTPTANLYFFQVCMIQLHLRKNWNSVLISKMQVAMFEKFTQYWESYSMVLAIAVVLDPRRKLDFVAFCYTKVYNDSSRTYFEDVFRELSNLFNWYKEKENSGKHHSVACDIREESSSLVGSNEDLSMDDFLKFKAETRRDDESKTELEIYLQEPFAPDDSTFDILKWWEVNESKYPILAAMARDILAIPVSTVASESAFSTSSRVIQKKRTCLKPYTIQALICLQDWLREKFSVTSMSNDLRLDTYNIDEGCDDKLDESTLE